MLARIYIALGEYDEALRWLEIAYAAKDPWLIALKQDQYFQPLHNEPDFQKLLEKLNFPEKGT